MPAAYAYVAVTLMLVQVNSVGPKLKLPVRFPIESSDLVATMVIPPTALNVWHPSMPNFGGRLDTAEYSFSFSFSGRLSVIARRYPWGTMTVVQRNDLLAAQPSLIGREDAYSLATNWLEAMQVNTRALEKESPIIVKQEFRWKNPENHSLGTDLLPLFIVTWGNIVVQPGLDTPKIDILIDGTTKEALTLRLDDDSVSPLPIAPIKNPMDLWSIPDDVFLKYSDQQRKDLLARFAAMPYDSSKEKTNEPPGTDFSIRTDTGTNVAPASGSSSLMPGAGSNAQNPTVHIQ